MCKFYKLLYWLIPVKSFQSFLIRKHFSGCDRCQREIEIDNRLKEMVIPDWIRAEKSFWPQIKPRLSIPEEKTHVKENKDGFFSFKKWHWAMAGLALVCVMGSSVLIYRNFQKKLSVEKAALINEMSRVKINYAEIKGKKAIPYIYQTPTVSFIWFAETK
jgi:hypothetical protein